MNRARKLASSAKADMAARAPQIDKETKDKVEGLEKTVEILAEHNRIMAKQMEDMSVTFSTALNELAKKTRLNEAAISRKTIESLSRSAVARIMRDEADRKGDPR